MNGTSTNELFAPYIDDIIAMIPGFDGSKMNSVEAVLTCPFCGKKQKLYINRLTGLAQCWSATCPSRAGTKKGFNIQQLYGAVYGLSYSETIKELKSRLNLTSDDSYTPRPERVVYKMPEVEERASADHLDAVYSAFLNELGLSEKHRMDLRSRGFTDDRIEKCQFRSFPRKDEIDYFSLCKRLMSSGLTLRGVPGFFQCKNGSWCFVQVTKGIIMPTRDPQNRIVGLQIRKDDDLRVSDEDGTLEAKCTWFSSKTSNHGCSPSSPVHFACDWIWDKTRNAYRPYIKETTKVLLTEGMMKAELVNQIQPDTVVMSVPGVNSVKFLKPALNYLKELGVTEICLAFDMDYETNKDVEKAMENVKKIITDNGMRLWKSKQGTDHLRWDTYVEITKSDGSKEKVSLLKGIDDLQVYRKYGIIPKVVEKV